MPGAVRHREGRGERDRGRRRVGVARIRRGGGRAVTEVPQVGDRPAARVHRPGAREVDREGGQAVARCRSGLDQRRVRPDPADLTGRERQVVDQPIRTDDHRHRSRDVGRERLDALRLPGGVEHDPLDEAVRIVVEEEVALILLRVRGRAVERTADRGTANTVVIGVERATVRRAGQRHARRVVLERRLRVVALIARPAVIGTLQPDVHFLPRVPPDIPEHDPVGARLLRETERVTDPVQPHLRTDRVRAVVVRVVDRRRAVLVDPQDLAAHTVEALRPQGPKVPVGSIADTDEHRPILREHDRPQGVTPPISRNAIGTWRVRRTRRRSNAAHDRRLGRRKRYIGVSRTGSDPHQTGRARVRWSWDCPRSRTCRSCTRTRCSRNQGRRRNPRTLDRRTCSPSPTNR